jgi:hypothetical protein
MQLVAPTAFGPFLANQVGYGTWTRKGATLTLKFADGAVAVLTVS